MTMISSPAVSPPSPSTAHPSTSSHASGAPSVPCLGASLRSTSEDRITPTGRSLASTVIALPRAGRFAHVSGGREQSPLALHTLESAAAPVSEGQPGTDDEIFDGAGRQHFAGCCLGCDAGADVHGDAADVVSHALALARVQAGAHLETERAHGIANGQAAAHAAGWAVEQHQEAIPRRRDL